ncbi:MAG: type II toxin-antitoxin system RelE/ParE family toxin [Burkholderiales bacterium]|nr:type II toxin-antitoxin system RelE/ParE family toxin [Burkholderiales bacterium]
MKLVIVPPALNELHDAAAYYTASASVELGFALLAAFERTANLILANPKLRASSRVHEGATSSAGSLTAFIYQIAAEELRVIAVAHHRRRPGYWVGRK